MAKRGNHTALMVDTVYIDSAKEKNSEKKNSYH